MKAQDKETRSSAKGNYPSNSPAKRRKRLIIECKEPTRTKQAFKDECDVNNIVRKINESGIMPPATKQALYGDFSTSQSYQESLNLVIHAQEQFDALPASVRRRFANDPAQFLEFSNDPNNLDEMVKLGLAVKKRDDSNDAKKLTETITSPDQGKKDEKSEK